MSCLKNIYWGFEGKIGRGSCWWMFSQGYFQRTSQKRTKAIANANMKP
jgi:hypothetical protein